MRFASFSHVSGGPRAGLVLGDRIVELAAALREGAPQPDVGLDLLQLIRHADELIPVVREVAQRDAHSLDKAAYNLSDVRLCAPIPVPPKNVMCLGRNYPEHAAESARAFGDAPAQAERPDYPTIFTKAHTALIGPYDDIVLDPSVTQALDWEVELAVVIGRPGRNITPEHAADHIFGYTVLNDVSARDLQRRYGGQLFKGKSLDRTTPVGPWIVTPDEAGPWQDLTLTLKVNGELKQHDRAGSMTFGVPQIISALSLGMTLEPGDLIATGTPAGVGFGREPQQFLRIGDIVECEITGIGVLRNRVTGPSEG